MRIIGIEVVFDSLPWGGCAGVDSDVFIVGGVAIASHDECWDQVQSVQDRDEE